MFRIPVESPYDFLEWADGHSLSWLPSGFVIWTRVRLAPSRGLPEYLKSKKAQGFTMAPRKPKQWLFLVNVTLEAMLKISKKGWSSEFVEVFVRWEPKVEEK